MGLFGKKKEEKLDIPKPSAPFIPTGTPSTTTPRRPLSEELGLGAPKSSSPSPLPPLPADVSQNVHAVSKRVDALNEKISGMESDIPPMPESAPPLPPLPNSDQTSTAPTPPESAESRAKVFVRLDKYNEILRTVNNMEAKMNELQNALKRINEVKTAEQNIISSWSTLIEEARTRVEEVNSKLPKA